MLTTSTRPYTPAEFDEYSDQMSAGRIEGLTIIVFIGILIGGVSTLCTFAVNWLYVWLTSGTATWTLALIVGASIAILTIVGLWLVSGDDWTDFPPELATDVDATAYAAWRIEDDGLDTVLVLRVEADQYLLITQNSLTPSLLKDKVPITLSDTIPSNIRVVLLGEREFRRALNVSLSGLAVPLKRIDPQAASTNLDDDETPIPDGLYTTAELPAKIKGAIGVA